MYSHIISLRIRPGKMDQALNIFRSSIPPALKNQRGNASVLVFSCREKNELINCTLWDTYENMLELERSGFLEAPPIGVRVVCLQGGRGLLDHPGSSRSFPAKESARATLPTYIVEPIWKHDPSRYCPQQCRLGRTIRSAATAPAYRIGRSSRSWCRFWSSAVLTRGSPMTRVRQPPCVADATSGSKRG